jgi:hypothetical protein
MSTEELKSKPLWQMTGEEFLALQQGFFAKEQPETNVPDSASNARYVYGLKGIAELFDCSISTANRIKTSGTIDKAIKQIGRKIIVDAPHALTLIESKKRGRR